MNEGFVVSDDVDGRGTPLSAWQASSRLAAVPAISADLLVPSECRAVIVAPHPDDEVLGCGGLMSQLHLLERELLLISVTNGTASHPGSALWPASRLAAARPEESTEALQRLGLPADLPWLRSAYQDGAVVEREAELQAFLERHLLPTDVVFGTWRGDGHGDHEAVGRACANACAAVGAQFNEVPIWAWHWAGPEDERLPWERARKLLLDPALLARKHDAVQAFVSQLQGDPAIRLAPVLPVWAQARLLQPFELVFL
ncbi:acetylglucosaminylphosphatidylinositol deacetylase [Pseudomonas sp. Leaf127]|uniref:PIG-L deacetylase family protein n=1 Tax=Pseudomonas sp. Leaf127 TaxID=1736267 RepID=UPI0007037357|nr:PIG-L family deacetylase [Pseudomonas sp. Leaf127]KQQ62581.1 acetylglucosaminylphosphatidylinositol deacetylase [Pseudomonas sp. Leaf127]